MIFLKDIVNEVAGAKNRKRIVYVDMDGVLCDFRKAWNRVKGSHPGLDWWEVTMKEGPRWWATMDWMPGGPILWKYVTHNFPNVKILSAVDGPEGFPDMAIEGKMSWCRKHLGIPYEDMIFAEGGKSRYARRGDILIDDQIDNYEEWRAAGGIAILHSSAIETINILYRLK